MTLRIRHHIQTHRTFKIFRNFVLLLLCFSSRFILYFYFSVADFLANFQTLIIMHWRDSWERRLVIDSGSQTIRLGTAASFQPQINYLNCIAIDRGTGNKLYGTQLDNIFDETKLIYEKNNTRGVTVKF